MDMENLMVICTDLGKDVVERYRAALRLNDIPITVNENGKGGYTMLVPKEFLDDAHVVIESLEYYDDFYESDD